MHGPLKGFLVFFVTALFALEGYSQSPNPDITGPAPVCEYSTDVVYSTDSTGNDFSWSVNNGTITQTNDHEIFVDWGSAAVGSGAITVTETDPSTNNSGQDTLSLSIESRPNPSISGQDTVCENSEPFTYSTGFSSNHSYNWSVEGGNIVVDNQNQIDVEWHEAGQGKITLTETDSTTSLNCDTTIEKNVHIAPRPTPSINGQSDVCAHSSGVEYSVDSFNTNHTYSWSVSGGEFTSETDSQVAVSWDQEGSGSISLTETSEQGCDTTVTKNISIHPQPDPEVAGPDSVCAYEDDVSFFAGSFDNQHSYNWSVTGGTIEHDTGDSIEVDWGAEGSGTVTLTEISDQGCDSTYTKNVTILSNPAPEISGPNTVCQGVDEVYSVDQYLGDHSYQWDIVNGSIVNDQDSIAEVVFGQTDSSTVKLTATNEEGCDTTVSKKVNLTEAPDPQISGPDTLCANTDGQNYSTSQETGHSYDWTVQGGSIAQDNGHNVDVDWGNPGGVGQVIVGETDTTTASDCTPTDTFEVAVIDPVPDISGPSEVCEYDDGYTYTAPDIGSIDYTWSVQQGQVTQDSGHKVVVEWFEEGSGSISVSQDPQNLPNCDSSNTKQVTIDSVPDPQISGPDTVCENTSGHQYSVPFEPDMGYDWNVEGGTITQDTQNQVTVSWQEPGNKSVELTQKDTLTGANCDTTVQYQVYVEEAPDPNITGPDEVCENTGGYNYQVNDVQGHTYQWSLTNGSITDDNDDQVTVSWDNPDTVNIHVTQTDTTTHGNCQTSESHEVTIYEKPDPDIQGPDEVCEFDSGIDYSTDYTDGNSYSWSVNGGTVDSTDSNTVEVSWGDEDTGQVIVQETPANLSECQNNDTLEVIIHPNPSPDISGPGEVCAFTGGHNYSVQDLNQHTYTWNVSGGTIDTNKNHQIEVSWDDPDTGTVSLTKVDTSTSVNCGLSVSMDVVVQNPEPNISGPGAVCEQDSNVTFSTPSEEGHTYDWNVSNADSVTEDENEVTVDWGGPDTSLITVNQYSPSLPSCDATDSADVFISNVPQPQISGPDTVCQYSTGNLYQSSLDTTHDYNWQVSSEGVINKDSNNQIYVEWVEDGNATVTLTETNTSTSAQCDTTVQYEVTVESAPDTDVTGPDASCKGHAGNFYQTDSVGNTTYDWTVDNGTIVDDNLNDIEVQWSMQDSGKVKLTQTDTTVSLNCSSKDSVEVQLVDEPDPEIKGPDEVCEYTPGNFYATEDVAGNEYEWTVQGGNIIEEGSDSNEIEVQWGAEDTGLVIVKENPEIVEECQFSDTLEVTKFSKPKTELTGPDTVCAFTSGHHYDIDSLPEHTYDWQVTGGDITQNDKNNITVSWDNPDTGEVQLIKTDTSQAFNCDTTINYQVNTYHPEPDISGPDVVCEYTEDHVYSTDFVVDNDYQWTVQGGTITEDNHEEIVVQWDEKDTGQVSVTQNPSFLPVCDSSDSKQVIIENKPGPEISGPDTVCEHSGPHTYSTDSVPDHTYDWSISGGQIVNESGYGEVQVDWHGSGSASLSVTQTDTTTTENCDTTAAKDVSIAPIPQTQILGDDISCRAPSQPKVYQASDYSGHQYSWSVSGGTIDEDNGDEIVVDEWDSSMDTATITLTQTDTTTTVNCDTTLSKDVNLEDNPPQPNISGRVTVCENTGGYTYSTPVMGSEFSYSWSVNGGFIQQDNGSSVDVYWGDAGAGIISLIITDESTDENCTNVEFYPVNRDNTPQTNLSGPQEVCEHTGGHHYSTDSVYGYTYDWTVSGGQITNDNLNDITVDWGAEGQGNITITVTDTATENDCDSTVSQNVNINRKPDPEISGNFTVCEYSDHNAYTAENPHPDNQYNWTLSDEGDIKEDYGDSIVVHWKEGDTGKVSLTPVNAASPVNCDSTTSEEVVLERKPHAGINGPDQVCAYSANHIYTAENRNISSDDYSWSLSESGSILENYGDSIVVHWTEAGEAEVTLSQTDTTTSGLCDSTLTQNVSVERKPFASIKGSDYVCEYSQDEVFYAENPHPDDNYDWSVSGGNISQDLGDSIKVDWSGSDTGTVTLTQTHGSTGLNCDSTDHHGVTIERKPVADINGPNLVCEFSNDHSYYANNKAISNDEYAWSISESGEITEDYGDSIVVDWKEADTGTVTLNQADTSTQLNCDSTVHYGVDIERKPVAGISGPGQVCEYSQDQIYKAMTPESGDNYNWSVSGTGDIAVDYGDSIAVNWSDGDTGTVTLIQEDPTTQLNCDSTIHFGVNLERKPEANITGADQVCEYSEGHIYEAAAPQSGDTYSWSVSSSGSIKADYGDSIAVHWSEGDTGTVTLTQTDSSSQLNCDSTIHYGVNIERKPVASIEGSQQVCEFSSNHIYTAGHSKQGDQYDWTVSDQGTIKEDFGDSIVVHWAEEDTGTITLTQTDPNSPLDCDSTIHKGVNIERKPVPAIGGADVVCEYSEGHVYYAQNPSGTDSYNWSLSASGSIQENNGDSIIVHWGEADTGTVTLTQIDGSTGLNCDSTVQKGVNIERKPVAEIEGPDAACEFTDHNVYKVANPDKADAYDWSVSNQGTITTDYGDSIEVYWGENDSGSVSLVQTDTTHHLQCDSLFTLDVKIEERPSAEVHGPDQVCEYSQGHIYTPDDPVGPYDFDWEVSGEGTIIQDYDDSIEVHWAEKDTGTVSMTKTDLSTHTNCDTTYHYGVDIERKPKAQISGPDQVCEFTDYQTYSAVDVSPGDQYDWSVSSEGSISQDNGESIVVQWGGEGQGTVTLTHTDTTSPLSCDSTITLDVDIERKPVAGIEGPDEACQYTGEDSYYATNRDNSWDAYDWSVSNEGTITRDYGDSIIVEWGGSDTGTVTLTQTDASTDLNCDSTITMGVKMLPRPRANILGDSVVCEYSDDNIYTVEHPDPDHSYDWSITGEGSIKEHHDDSIVVSWQDGDSGKVHLTQSDTVVPGSCDSTTTFELDIERKPVASVSGTKTACQYSEGHIYVADSTRSSDSYSWSVSQNGTIQENHDDSIVVDWHGGDNGEVTLTQTDTTTQRGCDSNYTHQVDLERRPLTQINGPATVCEYSSGHQYSADTSVNHDTYDWSVSENGTITADYGDSVEVHWEEGESGTVELTQTDTTGDLACDSTVTLDVTIERKPVTSIDGPDVVCEYANDHSYVAENPKATDDYDWQVSSNGDITADHGDSIVVDWKAGSSGHVELTQTDTSESLNCDSTISYQVTIERTPKTKIEGQEVVCENTGGHSYYTQNPGAADTYDWQLSEGGTVVGDYGDSIVVFWEDKGTESVQLTQTDTSTTLNCDSTNVFNVTVERKPDAELEGPDLVCEYSSGHAYVAQNPHPDDTYAWSVSEAGEIKEEFGDSIIVQWNEKDTGTVTLTQIDSTDERICNTSASYGVNIERTAETSINGPSEVCDHSEGHIYRAQHFPDSDTLQWQVSQEGTLTENWGDSIEVSWDQDTGTVSLKQVDTSTALNCDSTYHKGVNINRKPEAAVSGPEHACENEGHYIYSPQHPTAMDDYAWSVSEGNIEEDWGDSIAVEWNEADSGTITLTQQDTSGAIDCDSTIHYGVDLHRKPEVEIAGPSQVCEYSNDHIYHAKNFSTDDSLAWETSEEGIITQNKGDSVWVNWSEEDTGHVTLTQTDTTSPVNCPSTDHQGVDIERKPVAAITGPGNVCTGSDGHMYKAENVEAVDTFSWNVTQGGTIAENYGDSIEVNWTEEDSGTVQLTQVDSSSALNCDSTISKGVTIEEPIPEIAGPDVACEYSGGYLYKAQNKRPQYTFEWKVSEEGAIEEDYGDSIEVSWNEGDTGEVTLTTTDATLPQVCQSSTTYKVDLERKPRTAIQGPEHVCEFSEDHLYYADSSTISDSYNWSVGDNGTITADYGDSIEVHWQEGQQGSVQLTQADTTGQLDCDSTATFDVSIERKPVSQIHGPEEVCEFSENHVYYADTSANSDSYSWSVSENGQITEDYGDTVEVHWQEGDSGMVQLTQADTTGEVMCDSTQTLNVSIERKPRTAIHGPQTVCEYSESNTYYADTSAESDHYDWNIQGNGTITSDYGDSIEVHWQEGDTATLTLTQTDTTGNLSCDSIQTSGINIERKPVADIEGPKEVCKNSSNHIYSASNPHDQDDYQWAVSSQGTIIEDFGDSVEVNWGEGDSGLVTLTQTDVEDGISCDSTITFEVKISRTPEAEVTGPAPVCRFSEGNLYKPDNWHEEDGYEWSISENGVLEEDYGDSVKVNWTDGEEGVVTLEQTNEDAPIECKSNTELEFAVERRPIPEISGETLVCEFSEGNIYRADDVLENDELFWNVSEEGTITENYGDSIEVQWAEKDTGTVTLTQRDASTTNLCDSTIHFGVDIERKPRAGIEGPEEVCEFTQDHTYEAINTEDGDNFQWSVKGGNIQENHNDNIVVEWNSENDDSAKVTLIHTDNTGGKSCDSLVEKEVLINPRPETSISGDDFICEFSTHGYYTEDKEYYSHDWNVEGGLIAEGQESDSLIVDWQEPGEGEISITKTNTETGCYADSNRIIDLREKQNPEIEGPGLTCAEGDNRRTYYIDSSGTYDYEWHIDSGSVVGENGNAGVEVNWTSPGQGQVWVVKEHLPTGCIESDTMNVEVEEMPEFEVEGPEQICVMQETYQYSTPDWQGAEYQWEIEGGEIIDGANDHQVEVRWDSLSAGNIEVYITRPSLCEERVEKSVDINPFTDTGDPGLAEYEGCSPVPLRFADSQNLNASSLLWDLGDGNLNTDVDPQHSFEEPGVHNVSVELENEHGCSGNFVFEVQVFDQPSAEFVIDSLNNDTIFDETDFMVRNLSEGAIMYEWQMGNQEELFKNDKSPFEFAFEDPGRKEISLTAENIDGCADTARKALEIHPEEWLHVPNAFSPNDDGTNDKFIVSQNNLTDFEVVIKDRWGSEVYSSDDPDFEWDGTIDGEVAQEGVYLYYIQARGWSGESFNREGTLQLIR